MCGELLLAGDHTHWQNLSSAQCVTSIAVFCQYCFIMACAQCFLEHSGNSRAPRERELSPCAGSRPIYPGRAPFWARRDARRNLGVRVRLIRAVSTRRTTQSCIDPAFFLGRTDRVGASGDRRRRKVLRPDCPPKSNARSSPDQMACCMPSPDVASAARTVVLGPILGITLFSSRPN